MPNCGHERMHMILQQYSHSLWQSSDDWLVLTAKSLQRKHFPHYYTPSIKLHCWHKVCWVQGFMLLMNSFPTNQNISDQATTVLNRLVWVSLCPLLPLLSVLVWKKQYLTWSAVVAHLVWCSATHWIFLLYYTILSKLQRLLCMNVPRDHQL